MVVNDVFPPLLDKIKEMQRLKHRYNSDSDYGDDSDSEP